jgi:hypothetical protein
MLIETNVGNEPLHQKFLQQRVQIALTAAQRDNSSD